MSNIPATVCLDIAVVIVVARLVGALFRKFGQPPVIGEIIAGIILGPSLLGAFPGNPTLKLFPTDVRPSLNVLANLGVVLFMFIVGLEVDFARIRGRRRVAGTVSLASIAVPFGLAVLLATYFYHRYGHSIAGKHSLLAFSLFLGASMSVTAFPVLARILADRKMMNTDLGAFAMACAAVDDVAAWSLLAVVVAIVQATAPWKVPVMLIELLGLVVFMVLVVRPLVRWVLLRSREVGSISITMLAGILVTLLLAAWATSEMGIDLIFGGFIFGATFPKDATPEIVGAIVERIESVTLLLLLPLFFVVAGLSVNIRTIGVHGLEDLLLVLLVAVVGKFGGAALSARLQGVTTRRSFAVGALMNTRGLTELVILTVGIQLGVLTNQLFTLLVIMAIVTTILTGPLFRAIYPDRMLQADIAESERMRSQDVEYGVVVAVEDGADPDALIGVGADLAGPRGQVILVRFLTQGGEQSPYSGAATQITQMAAAMEQLGTVGRRRSDVAIHPMVQFSADPVGDLLTLTRRSNIDATVLAAEGTTVTTGSAHLFSDAECDLVTVRQGPDRDEGAVMVLLDRGSDAEAALELGARVALHRQHAESEAANGDHGLLLVFSAEYGAARTRRLAERLHSVGLADIRVIEQDALTRDGNGTGEHTLNGVLVVGRSAHRLGGRGPRSQDLKDDWPGTVLVVHGHDDPQRVGIDQRLGRLADINRPALASKSSRSEHP